jgi:hypothetical protein
MQGKGVWGGFVSVVEIDNLSPYVKTAELFQQLCLSFIGRRYSQFVLFSLR